MRNYFIPYNGTEPYVFVSYAHKNSDNVMDIITPLREMNYRIWYDEGIPAGSDWPKNIRDHVNSADTMLFFVSKESLASDNCYSEIKTAVSLGKKLTAVRLDDTPLNEDWDGLLKAAVFADAPEKALGDYLKGDYPAAYHEDDSNHNLLYYAVLSLCILLFAAVSAGTIALAAGKFDKYLGLNQSEPETYRYETAEHASSESVDMGGYESLFEKTVDFKNQTTLSNGVKDILNIGRNDPAPVYGRQIADIESMYFCGNTPFRPGENGVNLFFYDGKDWFNGNIKPGEGDIYDLSVFTGMPKLSELVAVNEKITDISQLGSLQILEHLNISGNPISSLDIAQDGETTVFRSLRELNIEHTEIHDLTPLAQLESLQTVTVTQDMLPITVPENAGFEVELVK